MNYTSTMQTKTNGRSLPTAWQLVKLGDVCESKLTNRDPRREPDSKFIYVDITSIDASTKTITEPKNLLGKDAPSRARQVIQTGDVIVSTTRPNLNAVAKITKEFDKQICSTGFCVLRPNQNDLDSDFLFHFVKTIEFIQNLSDLVKGALYPAVTDKDVRAQLIPLPPLDEQQRIASRLNEQLTAVESTRKAAEEQLQAAYDLPLAYLSGIFNNGESQKWHRRKLGEVCEITARQVDPKVPEYGALPHVNGENIESGTCQLLYLNSAADEGMTSGKYLFDAGDVLYSKLRPYLRKVTVADFKGVCSADMYPIKVNQDVLDSHYLSWVLVSDEFTMYADEESRRARMPKLNREQLFAFKAPIPSLDVQKQIAAFMKDKIEQTKQIIGTLESQLAEIESLPASLLREAFAGDVL